MKKLESSLKNMTIVLTLVAIVTGGLLAFVNDKTKGPIQEQKDKELADGIKSVIGDDNLTVASTDTVKQEVNGKEVAYVIHNTVDASKNPLGAAVESAEQGFGGTLKVLVGFDKDGVIKGYTVLEHSETPGLGAKAVTWFQKGEKGDIIGKSPSNGGLTVSKDGGEVDAITASTITSRAFLKAVNSAYKAYKQGGVDTQSGASQQNKKQ